MKRALTSFPSLAMLGLLFLLTAFSAAYAAHASDEKIVSRTAEIDGVQLHYRTAGHGAPLILLHGYAETSLMWKPVIPALASDSW